MPNPPTVQQGTLDKVEPTAKTLAEKVIMENLLQNVYTIKKKYVDIAEVTGENFNIFNVLKISRRETVLHTPLIAELLNPYGSHGQGNVFFTRIDYTA